MTIEQVLWATSVSLIIIAITYIAMGWKNVINCYKMWFDPNYWKPYNIVEIVAWITKATIIVPGLIFKIDIWWLYFLALITSVALMWASNKKLLPTLVGFNSLWVWLSCMVLAQTLVN